MDARDFIQAGEAPRTAHNQPVQSAAEKPLPRLDRQSRRFLELSPFFCLGSTRRDGLGDVSLLGGEGGFVHVLNDTELAFPDRLGNDPMGNIVREPGVGLMFFVPGVEGMLKLNGLARLTMREDLMTRLAHEGKRPRTVVLIEIREVYFQCSEVLRRTGLWKPDKRVSKGRLSPLEGGAKGLWPSARGALLGCA